MPCSSGLQILVQTVPSLFMEVSFQGGRLVRLHLVMGMHSQLNPAMASSTMKNPSLGGEMDSFDHDYFRTHSLSSHKQNSQPSPIFQGVCVGENSCLVLANLGCEDPSSILLPYTLPTWISIRKRTFDASIWMALVMC